MARKVVDRILEGQEWLDPVARGLQRTVGAFFRGLGPVGRWLKDVLHGTKSLGHPLHPALTDIPLGAWIVGTIADYVAIADGSFPRSVGTMALGVGLVGALGAAASGYTDFHETFGRERRAAVAHGLWMSLVVVVQAASFILRLIAGSEGSAFAVGLSTVGLVLTGLGMYLGGHVVYGFGTMVNRSAFVEGPAEPVVVGVPEDFPEGQMRKVQANGMDVLVVRRGAALFAISNTCSHAGGPLHEGTLEGDTVTCPWHRSRFSIVDGSVRGGPTTFPQPRLEVIERPGRVEVRLLEPTH